MKTFNLQEAIAGNPLVTRDGREAKFIAYVPEAKGKRKLMILLDEDLCLFYENGIRWDTTQSEHDLFMAEEKTVVYVNVYNKGLIGNYYENIEDAKSFINDDALVINEITINPDGSLETKIVHRYE